MSEPVQLIVRINERGVPFLALPDGTIIAKQLDVSVETTSASRRTIADVQLIVSRIEYD